MRCCRTVIGIPSYFVQFTIASRLTSGSTTKLPLRFRGKPNANSGQRLVQFINEFLTIIPTDGFDWTIWPIEFGWRFVGDRFIQGLSAGSIKRPKSFCDRDPMLRPLIIISAFFVLRRSHQKFTSRNPSHSLNHALDFKSAPEPKYVTSKLRHPIGLPDRTPRTPQV